MEYYVISPNIYNDGDNYADMMYDKGIAAVGWKANDPKGMQFKSIKDGDCIIVAKRNNWHWEYHYMGLVVGEEEKASYGTLSKKLSPIVKLDSHCKLNFDIWSANGSNQIPSPQRIDNNKGNNRFIIEQINILFRMEKYIELFRTNRNLILTGAPGTGKTHLAKAIADKMGAEVGFVQFHPSYDYTDFVEGLRPVQDKNGNVGFERRDGVFKLFCKKALMPQDDALYQDAIDRFKKDIAKVGAMTVLTSKTSTPFNVTLNSKNTICVVLSTDDTWSATDKNLIDYLKTGLYDAQHDTYLHSIGDYIKKTYLPTVIAHQGHDDESKPFVFIIDEINRGEISKIFGELFFSIDPGYRGKDGIVQTQYQNMVEEGDVFKEGFYVPENVYIIGTMNDIDRSVESMDFAMRRRFAWKEVTAEESFEAMKDSMTHAEEIKKRMTALNDAICDEKLGLNKSYQIGAAYFLKLDEYDGDFDKLWEYHLKGLLSEYLRGNRDAEKQLEKLKKAYDGNADSQSE